MRGRTVTFNVMTTVSLIALAACGTSERQPSGGGSADRAAPAPTSLSTANAQAAERATDSTQAAGVPTAIADVGTHGEDLYDQVKALNWTHARAIMDSLDQSAAGLKPKERAQLSGLLDTLHRAVAAHQRDVASEAANRVTFVGANLTESYHPKMPADIVRLDYYGRELEIWAARKNTAKLRATAMALRQTWGRVKAVEISHGGTAAAARMDSLIAQLATAGAPSDYARLATPLLDAVDELEKPFS